MPEPTAPILRVRTVPIEDPGPLLEQMPATEAYAWVRHGDGIIGWGEAARHKPGNVAEAAEWWRDLCAHAAMIDEHPTTTPGAGLLAFGSFVFDPTNSAAVSSFVVPRMVLGRRNGRGWLTSITSSDEPPSDDRWPAASRAAAPSSVKFGPGGLTPQAWQHAVRRAVAHIEDGELAKVVLARDVTALAEDGLDLRWLAARLAERYPNCWTYLVDGLVGASPELLVRREAGLVTSRVLAGTLRRSVGDGPDHGLAAALRSSDKDREEHAYAVGSVARALAPFCSGMNVPEAPYVLALPNLLHLATDVTGVSIAADALTLLSALHPSAAVCGTPTAVARGLISELEHLDRGRYAGPVGWIDAHGDGEWAIALRCGQQSETDRRELKLYAGCGIVAGSDPDEELAESDAKLVPMRDALTA